MRESERFLLIDQIIAEKGVASLQELQTVLQVSAITVKRDLRKMREKMDAPIVYSRERRGYCYDVNRTRLVTQSETPRFSNKRYWYSEDELQAWVAGMRSYERLAQDGESWRRDEWVKLLGRMRTLFGLTDERTAELLSRVKIFEPFPRQEPSRFFPVVGSALCEHRRLQTAYEPVAGQRELLEVSPQRLVFRAGLWYLDVYSYQERQYRTLLLTGLTDVSLLPNEGHLLCGEELARLDRLHADTSLESKGQKAELIFDEDVSSSAALEVWHPQQTARMIRQRLSLTVPYENEDEMVGRILKWGSHVEVRSPLELRRKICTTLEQILSLYR